MQRQFLLREKMYACIIRAVFQQTEEPGGRDMGGSLLSGGDKVLFIGDSITDCGRRTCGHPLGEGYARIFSELSAAARPELNLELVNHGIGGNTILDLKERWDSDAVAAAPSWIIIMIGINDLHGCLRGAEGGVPPDRFRDEYDALLGRAGSQGERGFVVMDPFYISKNADEGSFERKVEELLPEYLSAAASCAEKHGVHHIRTNEIFSRHLNFRPASFFCPEPVHPNRAGHTVIAYELAGLLLGI